MDNMDLDKLLNSKVSGARKKKVLSSIVAVVLCAGIVTGAGFGIKAAVNANKERMNNNPKSEIVDNKDDKKSNKDQDSTDQNSTETDNETEKKDGLIDHTIQMIWFGDDNYSQFDSIAINVVHGEKIVQSISLSSKDGWKYSWSDEYPAEELSLTGLFPDGVTAEFSVSGENFIISSTYTPVEKDNDAKDGNADSNTTNPDSGNRNHVDDSEVPQTGLMNWVTTFLLALGTVMILFGSVEIKKQGRL